MISSRQRPKQATYASKFDVRVKEKQSEELDTEASLQEFRRIIKSEGNSRETVADEKKGNQRIIKDTPLIMSMDDTDISVANKLHSNKTNQRIRVDTKSKPNFEKKFSKNIKNNKRNGTGNNVLPKEGVGEGGVMIQYLNINDIPDSDSLIATSPQSRTKGNLQSTNNMINPYPNQNSTNNRNLYNYVNENSPPPSLSIENNYNNELTGYVNIHDVSTSPRNISNDKKNYAVPAVSTKHLSNIVQGSSKVKFSESSYYDQQIYPNESTTATTLSRGSNNNTRQVVNQSKIIPSKIPIEDNDDDDDDDEWNNDNDDDYPPDFPPNNTNYDNTTWNDDDFNDQDVSYAYSGKDIGNTSYDKPAIRMAERKSTMINTTKPQSQGEGNNSSNYNSENSHSKAARSTRGLKEVDQSLSDVGGLCPLPTLPALAKGAAAAAAPGQELYYSRNPRPVDYKPYTLQEYKRIKPQGYVELGKLKPDLNREELVAKRANHERIKEFSKNLQSFNKQVLLQQPKLPPSTEASSLVISKQLQESKRAKAVEFAKLVPKPKVQRKVQNNSNWKISDGAADKGGYDEDSEYDAGYSGGQHENTRLEELEAKHSEGKKQLDAIKKSLGL